MQGTFSVVAKSYSLHLNVQTVHSFISVRFDPTVARIKGRKEKKNKSIIIWALGLDFLYRIFNEKKVASNLYLMKYTFVFK